MSSAAPRKKARPLMKPPLAFFGGKQLLAGEICAALYQSPNWGERSIYVEPYFGGGAVFFAKEPQRVEVINDLNGRLVTFYRVAKDPKSYPRLKEMICGTPYARSELERARRVLRGEEAAGEVETAWAVWAAQGMAINAKWLGSFGYRRAPGASRGKGFHNRKARLEGLCGRLQNATIESGDALRVISRYDSEAALFYLDPPYAGARQEYGAPRFGDDELKGLLVALRGIKGRFVLSSFPHPLLAEAARAAGWRVAEKAQAYCLQERKGEKKRELLAANYPFALEGWEQQPRGFGGGA